MPIFEIKLNTFSDGVPTLSFLENAHLSWFRGYSFQVSGTTDGRGDYGSSSSSLQQDLAIVSNYGASEDKDKLFRQLITLSHIFEASMRYKELWMTMFEDAALLNKFVKESTEEVDSNLEGEDFNLETLLSLVEVSKHIETDELLKVYTLQHGFEKTETVGSVINVGRDYVAIQNVDTSEWYKLNTHNLLGVELEADDLGVVLSRLLYVLCCKAKIAFDIKISYINNDPIIGVTSSNPEELLDFHQARSSIARGKFLPKPAQLEGNNLFG